MRRDTLRAMRRTLALSIVLAHVGCSLGADLSGFSSGGSQENGPADAGAEASSSSAEASALEAGEAGAATSPYVRAVRDDGPIAYFRFEESGGQICANEIAGSPISCLYPSSKVTYGATGAVGRCARFEDFLVRTTLAGPTDFPNDVPFTIELWAMVDTFGDEHSIFAQMSGSPRTGTWLLWDDTKVVSETWVGEQHYLGALLEGTLPLKRFVHLALVHSDKDNIYVDGIPGYGYVVTNGLKRAATGVPFQLGSFVGCVDELAIYDKALGGDRFAVHMAARASGN